MVQLLESTRNYLKTSTRLGRRMSSYRDETSGSETSLHSNPLDTSLPASCDTTPPRPSSKKQLSGLYTLEGRNGSSMSQELSGTNLSHSRKFRPEATLDVGAQSEDRRRNSKSSERTEKSTQSRSINAGKGGQGHNHHSYQDRDGASEHMENEVPRGRSPTLSNTISTATSTYEMRPSDYPNIRQYQAHVWRRNLLEESIMHSLKLGYGERQHRSSSRQHQRSSKKDSPRARKAREQAILAAAMGTNLPPFAMSGSEAASQENIIDRSLKAINSNSRTQSAMTRPPQQQGQFRYEKNSPYQLDYNASMTNITQSFASFTLELSEHHATHIMASSAIPDLFKIKATIPGAHPQCPRSRRNSKSSLVGIVAPSPRVLTGKKPVIHQLYTTLPDVKDEEEEDDTESPLTPTSAAWANSVFASLDKVVGTKGNSDSKISEGQLKALEVTA